MDAILGRQRDRFGEYIMESELSILFREIADSAVQLASLNFPKLGRIYATGGGHYEIGPFVNEDGTTYGPFAQSVEYYQYLATNDGKRRWGTEGKSSSEVLRDRFASYLYRKASARLSLSNCGPFGLVHGDHGMHNFLFDENLRLTGILDWDYVHSAPALTCCNWLAMTQIRWPYYDEYWPGVGEGLLLRQDLFHKGSLLRRKNTQ